MFIKKELFKVSECSAVENTRYAINGVRIERRGEKCRAMATDGRIAIITEFAEPKGGDARPTDIDTSPVADFGAIVPTDSWDSVRKQLPNRKDSMAVFQEPGSNGSVEVEPKQGASMEVHTIEGIFPSIESVIPDYAPKIDSVQVKLSPSLLIRLLDAMRSCTPGVPITFTVPVAKLGPALLGSELPDGTKCTGVIMPVD